MNTLEGFKQEIALNKDILEKGVGFGLLLAMFLVQLFTSFFRSFFYTLYPIIHNSVFAGVFFIQVSQIIYVIILIGGGLATGLLTHLVKRLEYDVIQDIKVIAWISIVILSAITPFLFTINENLFNSITAVIFLVSLMLFILELRKISFAVEEGASLRAIVAIGVCVGGLLTHVALWLVLVTSTFPYFMVAIYCSAGFLFLATTRHNSEIKLGSQGDAALDRPKTRFFKAFTLLLVGYFVGFPTMFSNYSILNFEVYFAKLTLANIMLVVTIAALLLWMLFAWKPADYFVRVMIITLVGIGTLGCSYLFKDSFGLVIALIGGGTVIAGVLLLAFELAMDKVLRNGKLRSAYFVLLFSSILLMLGLGVNYAKFTFLLLIPEFQANDFSTNINLDVDAFIKLPFVLAGIALLGIGFLVAAWKRRRLQVLSIRMEANPNLEKREAI